jgi:hypothetical protein
MWLAAMRAEEWERAGCTIIHHSAGCYALPH